MKIWNLVVAGLVVVMSACVAAGPAVAHSRVLMLHPKFHRIGYVDGVQTSGPWVLLEEVTSSTAGTLINEQTGTRRSVPLPAGCIDSPVLGAASLVFECGNDVAVVSLTTGKTDQVAIDPQLTSWRAGCQSNLNYDEEYSCGLWASRIGSDWIEFDESCGEHCLWSPGARPDTYFFQNRQTGALMADPTGGSIYADLNAAGLARKFCSPLRVPTVPDAFVGGSSDDEEPGLGSVALDGSFAIVAGGRYGDAYDLEKCGSKLRQSIPTAGYPPPADNAHVVLWEIKDELRSKCRLAGELDGVFLPDRHRFILCVPGALFSEGDPNEIVLGPRTLFVGEQDGPLWEAPSPAEPR
jgi:hypothetical protein